MDFALTPEQEAFAKAVREFAPRELAPGYLQRAQRDAFPRDVYRRMGELGLLGITAPEGAGGQGADRVTAGMAAEEIAYADFNVAFFVLVGALGSDLLTQLGSEEVRAWGARVIAGEAVVAAALTEPGAGSDLAGITTRAERAPGGWHLSGEKSSISLAGAADAALVLARVEDGYGLFLVPLDRPGIARQVFADPGFRPIGRGALRFDGVEVPEAMRFAEGGRGLQVILNTFDFTPSVLGLMCLGCAQASLDEAAEYAKVRQAFGRPIARFQGVAFPMAEHATLLRAVRWVCYEALWRRDRGLPHTKAAAMAKWFAPQAAFAAAHEAILLHGNVGYTTESSLVQRMLDIMSRQIGDGTAQIQKAVIAREIFGRELRPY